ncbi:DUF1440 domain-containing protein, partial [Escherichia coli]|uniref:DUF1440 domain-containing protein n=1 Tax=Escherichia coli TaxID=562 RepID=UPI00203ACFA6
GFFCSLLAPSDAILFQEGVSVKLRLPQGLLAGALAQLFVHMISFPLMGLTPPLFDLPWYENVSEIFGHLVWFWSIEIIRRDLRNRITHEPDPEIPLGSNR